MRVEKFEVNHNDSLLKIINSKIPSLTYNLIQKLLRKKDIKLNGKRISKDINVLKGDIVEVYLNEDFNIKPYEIIFEDENILIINKKRNIEIISSDKQMGLIDYLKNDISENIKAVHRLDRNTEGLVVFAKNLEAERELLNAFKRRTFEKFYLAKVYGFFEKKSDNLVAFLKKDDKKSIVFVSDKKNCGYEEIKTNYKVLMQYDDFAIIEVELITGKTHQIRAHMAHIGHFVIGDEKYGNCQINKKFNVKYQNLIAYKLKMHFLEKSKLYYLNDKIFEINKEKIDFMKNL